MKDLALWLNAAASLLLTVVLCLIFFGDRFLPDDEPAVLASPTIAMADTVEIPALRDKITMTEIPGSPMRTDLGYGIAVNKGSSLKRRWLTLNANTSPVSLVGAGVRTVYRHGDGYRYTPVGTLQSTQPLSAIDVRFALFDVWGDHLQTLGADEVDDIAGPGSLDLSNVGTWYASENDVSEYMSSVAYVARVRTTDGKVWEVDPQSVVDALATASIAIKPEELLPKLSP